AIAPARGRRLERFRLMIAEVRADRRARTALAALLTAQVVMVSLMTVTPVHIEPQCGSRTLVRLTISLHVAGLYGLSPVVARPLRRIGHRAATGLGTAVVARASATPILLSGTPWGISAALILLGLGWSFVN